MAWKGRRRLASAQHRAQRQMGCLDSLPSRNGRMISAFWKAIRRTREGVDRLRNWSSHPLTSIGNFNRRRASTRSDAALRPYQRTISSNRRVDRQDDSPQGFSTASSWATAEAFKWSLGVNTSWHKSAHVFAPCENLLLVLRFMMQFVYAAWPSSRAVSWMPERGF